MGPDGFGNPAPPNPPFPPDRRLNGDGVRRNHPSLWDYPKAGQDTVANPYPRRNGKPWYFQERREAPLLARTHMGRQTDANESAFRFILNHSKAIVSNTYLGPYPRKRLADEPKPAPKTPIRESLNGMAPDDTQNEGRVHGGGLKKPEPREPTNVRVPFPKDHFPETACSGRLP